MATWDSPDLLARCKRLALRPTTDEETSDPDWYALLTEAEAIWKPQIANHAAHYLWSAPAAMTTADGGLTYTFASSITPLKVEVYGDIRGALLKPATYWDTAGDYVWEGSKIRFPGGRTWTFSSAPYARTISPPGTIDGSTASTIFPDYARILLVYQAVTEWANRGGLRDPTPFAMMLQKAWYDPANGGGLLVQLKTQNPFQGAVAWSEGDVAPTSIVQTSGYTPI